jgi:RimJ/RimL family protein N-acetyltransferase
MSTDGTSPRSLNVHPPESFDVDPDLVVRRYRVTDAAALRDAVTSSLEHLRPWMPWIAHEPQSIEQRETLIRRWMSDWDTGTDFAMGIFDGDLCAGSTGYHLRGPEGSIEIGYWLASSHASRGIMTRVVDALTHNALALPGITCVEIVTDEANEKSVAVAERCGYVLVDRFTREREAPGERGIGLRWRKSG